MGILATVIGSLGVQSVSALSPLVDENGHTVTTDTVEKNKELMNRYRWYDQLDNGDILERNIEATTNYFGYNLQIPSYMPEDYAVRDVKSRDHDVLEIVYTETGHNGEYGQKLTFSNTDIVYRMGWAIDTVVKPILEKTKYDADDAVSFTTPNGVSVHTLGSSNDSVQIAYWEKDNKVYMLYFATTRNQNFVSKIVDSVGCLLYTSPDTMTMAEVHPLTKGIAVHLYKKFGINMTVGVYAENKPSVEVLEIRKALDQVISLYTHVVQVHAFYVQEEKKVIYYDIIFDFDEEDPHSTLEKIKAEMQKRYPDYTQFAIVDTDFSN